MKKSNVVKCSRGKAGSDLTTLTITASTVEAIDELVWRWRDNREAIEPAILATEFGRGTVQIIEDLASKWIGLGLGVFKVEPGEGFGAKCIEGMNE